MPTFESRMLATNSYIISARHWTLPGIIEAGRIAKYKNPELTKTASTINRLELVKEISYPKKVSEYRTLMVNCSTGECTISS